MQERVVRGRIDGEQDQEGEGTDRALFIVVCPVCATLAPPGFPPALAGEPWVPFLLSNVYQAPLLVRPCLERELH
jgi:hypothetical protein